MVTSTPLVSRTSGTSCSSNWSDTHSGCRLLNPAAKNGLGGQAVLVLSREAIPFHVVFSHNHKEAVAGRQPRPRIGETPTS